MGLNLDKNELNRRMREIELSKMGQAQAAQFRQAMNEQQQRWIHNFLMETARDTFLLTYRMVGKSPNGDTPEAVAAVAECALKQAQVMAEAFGLIQRVEKGEQQ